MRQLAFYGKNRASRETWDQVISEKIPFNAGAMSGREGSPPERWGKFGQLPPEYAAEIKNGHPDYVVFSYQTPIMWHDAETGKWRFPRVKYSRTTTQHQSIAEHAIKHWDGEKWNTPDNFDDSGTSADVPSGGEYL